MHKLNKKAQIAEGILPVIALVLAGLTLFSFLTFDDGIQETSQDLASLTTQADFNKQHALAETKLLVKNTLRDCNFCTDSEELSWTLHLTAKEQEQFVATEKLGNLFGRLRNVQDFFLYLDPDETYHLEIKDAFITAEIENNKITKNFDICQTFNKSNGDYLADCEIKILK